MEGFSAYAPRRYAIHSEIGSGGVGTVHLGRLLGPAEFARTVAIRRLRPQFAKDAELVSMLLDGARLAARVRHPNVVPALDIVTAGEMLVVTEYVHGESLAKLLGTLRGRDARAPLPIVSGVFVGLLRGLHAVHEACRDPLGQPVIGDHDASPHGVLVGTDGVARWVHLGMGRTGDGARALVGANGTAAGAPLRDPGDWQIDVFAASAMLWEALAGRPLLPRISPEGFEPPSRYREEVTPEIDSVVAKGLAQAPAVRFATASDMAVALEAAVVPATPSQIGSWVESLAREALEERARLIARIEAPPPHARSASSDHGGSTAGADGAVVPADAGSRAQVFDAAAGVTRRERASAPAFETRRGLGPLDEATANDAVARSSSPAWALPRRPRGKLFAGIAAAVVAALVGGRYVVDGSRAAARVETVAPPAATYGLAPTAAESGFEPRLSSIPLPAAGVAGVAGALAVPSPSSRGEPSPGANAPKRQAAPVALPAPGPPKARRASRPTRDDVL